MSRAQGAWTEGCALAGGTVRGAGKRTRRGPHGCGVRSRILGALMPSFIRPALVLATGALVVGSMPAAALAHSGHAAHSKFSNRTSKKARRGSRVAVHSPRSRADGRSTRVLPRGGLLLAPGAGYGSLSGSALVRALQLRLARAGDRPGPIDGRYGPLTEHAVQRFQVAHGLTVDGIAGPVTLAALTSSTPVLYPGAGLGQQGGSKSVRTLQRTLGRLGFSPGPVDGRYGPQTVRAVERFQHTHRLKADGVVGIRTGRALSASRRHRVSLRHPTHRRLPERRPAQSGRRTHPTPEHRSVVRPAGNIVHAPGLPVTLLLLGIAMMGLGVATLSYERTRAKARRSRASESWRPISTRPASPPDSRHSNRWPAGTTGKKEGSSPADSRESNGSLVGTTEERERS